MVLNFKEALNFTMSVAIINCGWVIIGIIPFWNRLRVKKSTMVCWQIMVNGLFLAANFYAGLFHFNEPYFDNLVQVIFKFIYYILIVTFFFIGVDAYWGQLLYVFLLIASTSSVINMTSFLINRLNLGPGVKIGMAYTPTYLLYIAIMNIIIWPFLIWWLIKFVEPLLRIITKKEALILNVLPMLFLIVSYAYTFSNVLLVNARDVYSYIVVEVTWLVSFAVNLLLLRASSQRTRLLEENQAMEQFINLQKNSYAQLAENIEQTRMQRHDMRFHMSVISGYVKSGEYQKLDEYLAEYTEGMGESTETPLCANHTIDILARHFLGLMKSTGASAEVMLDIPPGIGIPDSEISVIFGNLFENASNSIAGQGQGAFFKAKCYVENGMLVILMRNSCIEEEKDFELGIGLSSVKAIAEGYGGFAQFDCYNGVFNAHVALKTE